MEFYGILHSGIGSGSEERGAVAAVPTLSGATVDSVKPAVTNAATASLRLGDNQPLRVRLDSCPAGMLSCKCVIIWCASYFVVRITASQELILFEAFS